MTTILYSHASGLSHVTPDGHPEQAARLASVMVALDQPEFEALALREAPVATDEQLARVHPAGYIAAIKQAVPETGHRSLDADTHLCPTSLEGILRAAGALPAAVDGVMAGEAQNAFCAMRPPGHHAERQTAMGFCFFGNVVVGAMHALEAHGLSRVAIVDFDVHHGNGTQDLVWNEARIFFASTHQSPLYPGTGMTHERGQHDNVLNVPVPPRTGGAEYREAFSWKVLPALRAFKPEMVFISAGFDAHADDPLANLELREDDFAWATGQICDVADEFANGRVISTLEGGYDLEALAASVAAHVRVLMERGDERNADR